MCADRFYSLRIIVKNNCLVDFVSRTFFLRTAIKQSFHLNFVLEKRAMIHSHLSKRPNQILTTTWASKLCEVVCCAGIARGRGGGAQGGFK